MVLQLPGFTAFQSPGFLPRRGTHKLSMAFQTQAVSYLALALPHSLSRSLFLSLSPGDCVHRGGCYGQLDAQGLRVMVNGVRGLVQSQVQGYVPRLGVGAVDRVRIKDRLALYYWTGMSLCQNISLSSETLISAPQQPKQQLELTAEANGQS